MAFDGRCFEAAAEAVTVAEDATEIFETSWTYRLLASWAATGVDLDAARSPVRKLLVSNFYFTIRNVMDVHGAARVSSSARMRAEAPA
jgi:hypothetical protein